MKSTTKKIMLPAFVAAFALASIAGSAQAFSPEKLQMLDIDLTSSQIEALEEAHQLRQDGAERSEIKSLLEAQGLDRETMREIKQAVRQVRQANREVRQAALESNDYEAFVAAIADSPLAEKITSEADFATFQKAHTLRSAGDREGAAELLAELDIEPKEKPQHRQGRRGGFGRSQS